MAPMVSGSRENNQEDPKNFDKIVRNEKKKLLELRRYVEKNFEYVGDDFSRKVREVFYDKNRKKTIYGTTTVEERKELEEEGIDLLSIPWVNKDN